MKKYIGSRAFYRKLFAVMVPILIQNVITNFVALLDNIMVGQVGTEPMSGVAIVNQLMFVFNLCVFGGLAGAGIFTAQFFGKGDREGVCHTVRFKMFIAAGVLVLGSAVLGLWGEPLIRLFLHEGQDALDLEETLRCGKAYLRIAMLQMLPFVLTQIYAGTLRETGETVLPMRAGIAAVFVNLVFNYLLIFGKLGFPALGVVGAAAATLLARFVECGIVLIWSHRHAREHPWVRGLYRSLYVPGALARQISTLGLPLLINELLWSGGMTVLNQCYSVRGLEVVSAFNIAITISDLFFVAFLAAGNAIAIIVGQLLGAGELERAVDEDRKLIAFSAALSLLTGGALALLSPLIPQLYNTTELVRALASRLILVNAALMPFHSFANSCYFTLRSGGKTLITFLFDSAYLWALSIPLAFVLSRFTALPILPLFIAVESLSVVKCVLGFCLVRSRKWVKNLVAD